jgi:hypothetical protein
MRKATGIDERIAVEARKLPIEQQKKVLEIVRLLRTASIEKQSISSLRGCGKKIWKGLDAQKYVDKLRAEWN